MDTLDINMNVIYVFLQKFHCNHYCIIIVKAENTFLIYPMYFCSSKFYPIREKDFFIFQTWNFLYITDEIFFPFFSVLLRYN